MQEDIERRTVAITVSATKLTGRALAKAFEAVLRKMRQGHGKGQSPQGRQSVGTLLGQGAATNTIPLDGDTRLFDRVARKWNVDYAFHKTAPKKYLLLFKSGQADAITACFAEYTKRVMQKDRRPSVLKQAQALGEQLRARPKEHERKREAAHDDR